MRTALAILAIAAACKGTANDAPAPPPPPPPRDASAAAPATAWTACETALRAAPKVPVTKRISSLLDACHPCGDWQPLLDWNRLQEDGGPTRKAIEDTMLACHAYCDPNAKMRFLGALDTGRGQSTSRAPWRMLGDICKDQVSAAPDARYMSAPYFALDRIARDAATHPSAAALLAAIDLPLPAVSVTGNGVELPTSPLTKPDDHRGQVTVTMAELRVGPLPHATLSATGVTVTGDYPGPLVEPTHLAEALASIGEPLVFAPKGMPASRVAAVIAASGKLGGMLAAASGGGPTGWAMYGAIPVHLVGKPSSQAKPGPTLTLGATADDAIKAAKALAPATLHGGPVVIQLDKATTVGTLAQLLGALAFFEVSSATLVLPKP